MNKGWLLEIIESSKKSNITSLNLIGNSLTELPPEIGNLTNLQSLDLSDNELTTLPSEIGNLTNLQSLVLFNNQLCTLPPEIGCLTNLRLLDLKFNQLTALPPEIGNLAKLQFLKLGVNQLTILPPEIGNLVNLQSLHFWHNQSSTIPPEIGNLVNLQSLDLQANQLIALPPEIGNLVNLRELDLRENHLKMLPPEIGNLKNLKVVYFDDNPFEFPPPEIIKQGYQAIVNYLATLLAEQKKKKTRKVNEAKLIVVGQGEVGKTCLCHRLIDGTYPATVKTEGIDIRSWKLPASDGTKAEMKINVWDFGGQEIYQATHRFFLTKRSLYLVVWDARQEDEYGRLDYWLRIVTALGKESPIFLILNKCDLGKTEVDLKNLQERHPHIQGFYQVSCADPEKAPHKFDYLRQEIAKSLWNLSSMRSEWPASWFAVRESLEKDGRNTTTHEEYVEICKKKGIIDDTTVNSLSEYLHDLGVILHFRDDHFLKQHIVLKPEWATNAVYKIIEHKQYQNEKRWILREDELDTIWTKKDDYPTRIHSILLRLMERFELAFKIRDSKNYMVAELLPREQLNFDWDDSNNLRVIYEYDFLPASVMPRFIVRMHKKIEINKDGEYMCWKEGVILVDEKTMFVDNEQIVEKAKAFVKASPSEKKIEIRVIGEKSAKRDLLAVIRDDFDNMITLLNIDKQKKIPCICSVCSQDKRPHLYGYENLKRKESRGKNLIECERSEKDVSISKLLYGDEEHKGNVNITVDGNVISIGDGNIIYK